MGIQNKYEFEREKEDQKGEKYNSGKGEKKICRKEKIVVLRRKDRKVIINKKRNYWLGESSLLGILFLGDYFMLVVILFIRIF